MLTSSAQSVPSGTPFTFTATVASTSGTPTGSVSFYDSTTLLGTATVNASGIATFSDTLSAGTHSVTATYTGDTNYNPSTSAAISVTVTVDTDFVVGSAQCNRRWSIRAARFPSRSWSVSVNGAYNAPVALTVTGLPAGATATFSPAFRHARRQQRHVDPDDPDAASNKTPVFAQSRRFRCRALPLGPLPIASVLARYRCCSL